MNTKRRMSSTPVLLSYDLGKRITAFSTTRHGGVSQGNYGEININKYCGDSPEAIRENCRRLCDTLCVEPSRLVLPHQVHGKVVRTITKDFFLLSEAERLEMLEGVDAVMTNVTNACLGVSTADCIPIIIYDAEHHAACAVHAGWRGTVQRIVQAGVEAMTAAYGSNPQKLCAVIGPGISLESFEVGDEVYEAFADAGFDMQRMARRFPPLTTQRSPVTKQKYHIDLWECNRQQLLDCGLSAEHIQVAGICTFQHCDDFFSARRLGISSGRIFTAFVLK